MKKRNKRILAITLSIVLIISITCASLVIKEVLIIREREKKDTIQPQFKPFYQ